MRALAPALTLAFTVFVLPSAARADDDILGTVGGFGLLRIAGNQLYGGGGVETSFMRYDGSVARNVFRFGYGGLAQVGLYGANGDVGFYGMAGGQVAAGMFGCELGLYGHSAAGSSGAALGLRAAPYVSLGIVWIGFGVNVPLTAGDFTPEFAATAGFKVPFTVSGAPMASNFLSNFSFGRGRPLTAQGAPVVATRASSDVWSERLTPALAPLDPDTRAALARAWRDDAFAEHASIAAFTRVSMQLLAVGAPPALLAATHEAALDEVRHARSCFALASAYGARWEAPGPLPVDALREAVCDRVTLAREALLEGCLGEGVAALVAREGAAACADPEVRSVLEAIDRDESAHAALGWAIVRWCLSTGGQAVIDALEDALRTLRDVRGAPPPEAVDVTAWTAAGRVTAARAAAIYAEEARRVTTVARRRIARYGAARPQRGLRDAASSDVSYGAPS